MAFRALRCALVLPLVSGLAPYSPPGTRQAAGTKALLPRRAVLGAILHLAPLYILGAPGAASAKSYRGDDPLTLSLRNSRDELAACAALLDARRWDEVRKVTAILLTSMTFKGYTGESVKSRAASWAAAGNAELALYILARRIALMRNLSTLENGVFAAQTSNKSKMLSAEELQAALAGALNELDLLLPKMGCDSWVVAGFCEILPLDKSIADLAKRYSF